MANYCIHARLAAEEPLDLVEGVAPALELCI
jgi:hypothetical protein